jgi:hypothetical protein
MDELDRFKVDAKGRLYWDDERVTVDVRLTPWQRTGAILVSVAVLIGGIGAAAQGWAAANEWACKLGWIVTWCPKNS